MSLCKWKENMRIPLFVKKRFGEVGYETVTILAEVFMAIKKSGTEH